MTHPSTRSFGAVLPPPASGADDAEGMDYLSLGDPQEARDDDGQLLRLGGLVGEVAIAGLCLAVILYPVIAIGLSVYMKAL
jgi:hypothetical protein